jgi:hypothetical protein
MTGGVCAAEVNFLMSRRGEFDKKFSPILMVFIGFVRGL